jgi:hypothetical protein
MNEDKRRGPRPSCNGTAMVQESMETASSKARLIDLSVEGCLLSFLVPHTMLLDSYAELTFQVNQLPFRVRGQVKSIRSEDTVSFHFPTLSLRVRGQLEDLVEELIEDHLKHSVASSRVP